MGILQARIKILKWVAMLSFRGSSQSRDRNQVSALQADSLLSEPPGIEQFPGPSINSAFAWSLFCLLGKLISSLLKNVRDPGRSKNNVLEGFWRVFSFTKIMSTVGAALVFYHLAQSLSLVR